MTTQSQEFRLARATSIFEKAAILKLRFDTTSGSIGVEDLWDLPLQHQTKINLDDIAIGLRKNLRDHEGAESFVSQSINAKGVANLELALEIVKHIIEVRKAERAAKEREAADADLRRRAQEILASRADENLRNMSDEELKALAGK